MNIDEQEILERSKQRKMRAERIANLVAKTLQQTVLVFDGNYHAGCTPQESKRPIIVLKLQELYE